MSRRAGGPIGARRPRGWAAAQREEDATDTLRRPRGWAAIDWRRMGFDIHAAAATAAMRRMGFDTHAAAATAAMRRMGFDIHAAAATAAAAWASI